MRIFISFLMFFSSVFAIYPAADSNQTMHKIKFEEKKDEEKYLVKVKFGKNIEVDCNRHFFTNLSLEKKVLEGYGYEYYVLSGDSSKIASTMMFCGDEKKTLKFLEYDPNLILPYNSSLEQVFYTPKDINVKYEIYRLVKSCTVEDE